MWAHLPDFRSVCKSWTTTHLDNAGTLFHSVFMLKVAYAGPLCVSYVFSFFLSTESAANSANHSSAHTSIRFMLQVQNMIVEVREAWDRS